MEPLPSGASVLIALLGELSVGDDVDAALVHDRDASQDLGHLAHQLGVRVDRGRDVASLEHGVNESGELESVGSEHRSPVTLDHSRIVGQVPETVSVYHNGNILKQEGSHLKQIKLESTLTQIGKRSYRVYAMSVALVCSKLSMSYTTNQKSN